MNWILLSPDELQPDQTVRLTGHRAHHARTVLNARPGQSLRVGLIDGPLGIADVLPNGESTAEAEDVLHLRPRWTSDLPPPRPRIDLLLALPRPKVLKRLWPVLASLGVGHIYLSNAWKVERSYFDSPALTADHIRAGLIEGLQQAGDTRLPRVTLHRFLRPFIESELPTRPPYAMKLVAHPVPAEASAPSLLARLAPLADLPSDARLLLAVGPEGGWIPDELTLLQAAGFAPLTLGSRILRTDTACIVLLGLLNAALSKK